MKINKILPVIVIIVLIVLICLVIANMLGFNIYYAIKDVFADSGSTFCK